MKGYGQITNPVTGRKVSVRGGTGQSVLRSYLQNAQRGGSRSRGRAQRGGRSRSRGRAQRGGRSRSRSRSRSRKRGQRGGDRDSRNPHPEDNLLYGMNFMPSVRIPVAKSGSKLEHPISLLHRRNVKLHGQPVGRNTTATNDKYGYHMHDTPYPSGADDTTIHNYGKTPTSLVNVKAVLAAVDSLPGRRAKKNLEMRVERAGKSGGKLDDGSPNERITIVTKYAKGDVFKTNYPAHVNAGFMAGFLQKAMKNSCGEKVAFHCLDIPVSYAPPSHMVTGADLKLYKDNLAGVIADAEVPKEVTAVLNAMFVDLNTPATTKSVWRKMLRAGNNGGLLDYHGLKISVRGMLFDFVMDGDTIRFAISKSPMDGAAKAVDAGRGLAAGRANRKPPNAKCLINPSGHLHGSIKYSLEGSGQGAKLVLKSCSLERENSGCWPSKTMDMFSLTAASGMGGM